MKNTNKKKTKRILALIGAALLFIMYAMTLVFALIGSESALMLLKADIACTILVPIMLYGYTLVARVVRDEVTKNLDEESQDDNIDLQK